MQVHAEKDVFSEKGFCSTSYTYRRPTLVDSQEQYVESLARKLLGSFEGQASASGDVERSLDSDGDLDPPRRAGGLQDIGSLHRSQPRMT